MARPELNIDVNIPDIISLTAQLAQVLAEEADLLQEMRISEIAPLQQKKTTLTRALEIYKRMIEKDPTAIADADDDEREDLRTVLEVFDAVLHETYRRLLVARDVNQCVVEAIAGAVGEQSKNRVYDEKGSTEQDGRVLSVTLDKKI